MALTAQALTTLDTLKSELGITSSSDDAYLERTIESASARLQSLLARLVYYQVDIVETVTGSGNPFIIVDRAPIVSISSIEYDSGQGTSTEYESTLYRIDDAEAGTIERENAWWPDTRDFVNVTLDRLTGTRRRNIRVTYTGGWVTPQQAADDVSLTRNLPYDIEDAVISMAVDSYRSRGRDTSIKSQKLLSASVSFDTGTSAGQYSALVQNVIEAYRRRYVL